MRTGLAFVLIASFGLVAVPSSVSAQTVGIREVTATDRSLIPLNTRLRYTTMIVLPEGEEILDVICGDRDFWVISAVQNVAHVKPAKSGAETNLNLVTARGTIYSFLLNEKNGSGQPDLKVYVNADQSVSTGRQKYYSAADVERLQTELTQAKEAATQAEQRVREAAAIERQQFPNRLQF